MDVMIFMGNSEGRNNVRESKSVAAMNKAPSRIDAIIKKR